MRPKVVSMVTHPMSLGFLVGECRWFARRGWGAIALCGGGNGPGPGKWGTEAVELLRLKFGREASPLSDALGLMRLWHSLGLLQPKVVNAGTPKAGLLGMIAARMARVPVRVYSLWGLRLETVSGLNRQILLQCERLACWCAHRVVCVSPSLRERAIALGLGRPDKFVVLGAGSSGGVVVSRFEATPERLEGAARFRGELGISEGAAVVGFVGRIVRDKGIVELVAAMERVPGAHLVLVGPFEDGDAVPGETRARIEGNPRIHVTGMVEDTAPYLHAMDVLVLPTYREGFPNVVLEAGVAEKPVVATRATGVVDALVDGVTGLLSEIGDVEGLAANIIRVLEDKELARRLGKAGRERAEREFQPERIYRELEKLYVELLREKGIEVELPTEDGTLVAEAGD